MPEAKVNGRPYAAVAAHYRQGRKLTGLSQKQFAAAAGIGCSSIERLEAGKLVKLDSLNKIRRCLRKRGVQFIYDGSMMIGVTLKEKTVDGTKRGPGRPRKQPVSDPGSVC